MAAKKMPTKGKGKDTKKPPKGKKAGKGYVVR